MKLTRHLYCPEWVTQIIRTNETSLSSTFSTTFKIPFPFPFPFPFKFISSHSLNSLWFWLLQYTDFILFYSIFHPNTWIVYIIKNIIFLNNGFWMPYYIFNQIKILRVHVRNNLSSCLWLLSNFIIYFSNQLKMPKDNVALRESSVTCMFHQLFINHVQPKTPTIHYYFKYDIYTRHIFFIGKYLDFS